MQAQGIKAQQSIFLHEPSCDTNRKRDLLQHLLSSEANSAVKSILRMNERSKHSKELMPEQVWSHIDQTTIPQHSEEFAKATWKCECGFKNYIDIWRCPMCGRDKPQK